MAQPFDLVVIGAGPGGYVTAIRAAQLGVSSIAVVDKNRWFGGTCLNVGCIPSKALLDSSELFHLAKERFHHHGIQLGGVEMDIARMMARKNEVVRSLTDGVQFLLKKHKVTFIHGAASLLGQGKVQVAGSTPQMIEGRSIVLASGSEPAPLPFLPFDGHTVVSSTEALSFSAVPDHLIVIGGGFIGLELGSVWCRLGAKVTVLEFLPRLLPANDAEIANQLQRSLGKQGLDIHISTKVTGATVKGGWATVHAERDGQQVDFTGEKILVSVGRRPMLRDLGLDKAGVALDPKTGKIHVNERFQTSAPGIYAIGDLIAGPMLAHKASEEGLAVAENLVGKPGHVNYATIPSVIYTHPEVAAVGLTEDQVKEIGRPYKVGKFLFAANGRAKAMDETEGLVKILADRESDRILGVHIFGARASDLLAELVLAMEFGACAEDIARTCHSHPSLSEIVGEAAWAASTGSAVHA